MAETRFIQNDYFNALDYYQRAFEASPTLQPKYKKKQALLYEKYLNDKEKADALSIEAEKIEKILAQQK